LSTPETGRAKDEVAVSAPDCRFPIVDEAIVASANLIVVVVAAAREVPYVVLVHGYEKLLIESGFVPEQTVPPEHDAEMMPVFVSAPPERERPVPME